MARRKANPNWGKPCAAIPDKPTAFEKKVAELGLSERQWATSKPLREWTERYCNTRYVPEGLLATWGLEVKAAQRE